MAAKDSEWATKLAANLAELARLRAMLDTAGADATPPKKRPRSMNASPTASAAAADVSKKAKVTSNDGRKRATGKRVVRKAR